MNVSESRDFPDWIGPMLVKELRQGLKARGFELTFIALQLVLVLMISYHALLYAKHGSKFNPAGLNGLFWTIVGLQLMFVAPLRALGGLASERKANTLELIFMTGLSSWRIAWGKWASLFFQSLLFVMAVLPYAMLRYFFGGINLVEDLILLCSMLLGSAMLTAVALAVSGLPLFPRIVGIGLLLCVAQGIRGIVSELYLRPLGYGLFGNIPNAVWCLLALDCVLVGLAALEFAGNAIAPVAENHALRQRLIVLCAWLPLPIMHALNLDNDVIATQWFFFGVAGLIVCWIHISAAAPRMRIHLDPFSRRGRAGFAVATLFQPGWPSALLFLTTIVVLLGVSARWAFDDTKTAAQFTTAAIMAGAGLITGPLIWRLLRLRARFPLIYQTIFIGACGGLVLFVKTMVDDRLFFLSDHPMYALLPPFGFFAMLDSSDVLHWESWYSVSVPIFAVYALGLFLLSIEYWRGMLGHHRAIRESAKASRVVAEVAA